MLTVTQHSLKYVYNMVNCVPAEYETAQDDIGASVSSTEQINSSYIQRFLTFRGPWIVSIFLLIYFQRDAILHSSFISEKLLYMFRVVSPPIIRTTYKCIYSIWYMLTVIATCRYCGLVGASLSVVWELYWPKQGNTIPTAHSNQLQ